MVNYKHLIIIPLLLLLIAIAFLLLNRNNLQLDIDLKGGTQMSIDSDSSVNANSLENLLKDYKARVRTGKGFTTYTILIDVESDVNTTDVISSLQKGGYDFKDYSIQSIGPALGATFFEQAQIALIIAFILMAIVIFLIFREPLPSFYVILSAFADIVETLAFSQIIGIKLSLATFSALLLLIGYSVDTDILLTTRVLKTSEGDVKEKIKGAMKTGLTMTGTTIGAVTALLLISASSVITQIASVLLIGLLLDVLNTWVTNSILLRMHVERKGVKNEA